MHTNETKDRFVELRAKGISLARIADNLKVSKQTLVDWNHQFKAQIRNLRAVELEALHERILATREADISLLSSIQKKISTTLADRELNGLRTKEVIRLYVLLRHEAASLERTVDSLFDTSSPPPPSPAASPAPAAPPAPPAAAPTPPAAAPTPPAATAPPAPNANPATS